MELAAMGRRDEDGGRVRFGKRRESVGRADETRGGTTTTNAHRTRAREQREEAATYRGDNRVAELGVEEMGELIEYL